MDRYTQHDRFGHFVPLASAECGEWTLAGKFEKRLYGDAASRLAAYEDTGLTPEEVIALRDAKDTNVPTTCKVCIDALHRRNHKVLTALGYKLHTFYKYCPNCGARMDGEP